MPQPNDLSRSLVALDHNSTIIAVVELSQSSTATLEGWITCASTPRAASQRASQKPSRPASKASAIRVILRPALIASSRQRCSRASSLSGLGSSFLRG